MVKRRKRLHRVGMNMFLVEASHEFCRVDGEINSDPDWVNIDDPRELKFLTTLDGYGHGNLHIIPTEYSSFKTTK